MRTLIDYKGKFHPVYSLAFTVYKELSIQRHVDKGKILHKGQIEFLKYPFITSVISARRRRIKVKQDNVLFYYSVKQPQLKLPLGEPMG